MSEYHKIENVWARDLQTHRLIEEAWKTPELRHLRDTQWHWTEKIDGMNIRVTHVVGTDIVKFGGKSENAAIPARLVDHLRTTFTAERMKAAFPPDADSTEPGATVILYGEGYGCGIQKVGVRYHPTEARFALFDVRYGYTWLTQDNVTDIGEKLVLDSAPFIGSGTLDQAIEMARNGFKSLIAFDTSLDAEGLIVRPECELFDRRGRRIIAKIKTRDFAS